MLVEMLRVAPLWKRVLARGMDYAILLGLWWVSRDSVLHWIYDPTPMLHVLGWHPFMLVAYALTWVALLPLPSAVSCTTLSKRALGVRLIQDDGSQRPPFWRILAREAFLLSTVFLAQLWAVACLAYFWSSGGDHDGLMMAGAAILSWVVLAGIWVAVKRRKGEYPQDLIGHTRVVQERGTRVLWLIPVAAAALVSLWWVARS
jgi:uncharacterized RDD family membrane protein YckC